MPKIAGLQARLASLEASGDRGKWCPMGSLPFGASMMWWMVAGGLGLLVVTPGLVLGYRHFAGIR